ncbi:MAG: hypothetical protein ABH883_00330 [Candidatus Omnitrophota bacterium]
MKILLEFTTLNYRIWHSLARRLKEVYPEAEFAGIMGIAPGGESAARFLKEQGDIRYEFIKFNHDIIAEAFKSRVDHEALKKFEESMPEKSLWRLIASDRNLGSSFMRGVLLDGTFINRNNSRENILKVVSGALSSYKKIFEGFRPDIFLPAIAMGSVSVHIFEYLCAEAGIPYIVPTSVRIKDIFAFASDVRLRFPAIDETYRLYGEYGEGIYENYEAARKLYDELMGELEDPQYFDRKLPCFNVVKLKSPLEWCKFILSSVKSFGALVWSWKDHARLNLSGDVRRQTLSPRVMAHSMKNLFIRQIQRARLRSPRFGEAPEKGLKYIYYPLHTSPEYSTQFQGTMWMDQLHTIEMLAKSVPHDWVVCVKEHPAILAARVRPLDFYDRIKKFPNVTLAPIDADTHKMIAGAEMVAVVTGTSGWEAIQRGKPLICFSDNFWDVLGLSRKCCDAERLSSDIHEESARLASIPEEERKSRIIRFLSAVIKHGFELSYPQQFCYEKGTPEQYDLLGRQTADALIKHLKAVVNQGKTAKNAEKQLIGPECY